MYVWILEGFDLNLPRLRAFTSEADARAAYEQAKTALGSGTEYGDLTRDGWVEWIPNSDSDITVTLTRVTTEESL